MKAAAACLFGAVGILMTSGCGILGPDEERVIGSIFGDEVDQSILVPQISSGPAFTATVFTAVGGCSREGDTEIEVSGDEVVITPYDIIVHAEVCPSVIRIYTHTVEVDVHPSGVTYVSVRARIYETGETLVVRDSVLTHP